MSEQQKKIEKRPGLDWTVYYYDKDNEGQLEAMTVFGARDLMHAYADAKSSFYHADKIEIVGVIEASIT